MSRQELPVKPFYSLEAITASIVLSHMWSLSSINLSNTLCEIGAVRLSTLMREQAQRG